jgi:hypothetical protein
MFLILASDDRVVDHGPWAGVIGLIVIGFFFYVIAGGPTSRGPRK